jgi:F-type H+-transporting ATPase subunit alpha
VEEQIAIIFAGTKGLLDSVPVHRIKEFERSYIEDLRINHKDVLEELAKKGGDVTKPEVEKALTETARDIAANFKN